MAKTPAQSKVEKPAEATTATNATTRTYEPAKLTAVSAAVPIPEGAGASGRGGKSLYPFDTLEVGQSFGVVNKSHKQMASVVSAANKRHKVDAKDADGNTIFGTIKVKSPDGTVTEQPSLEPKKVAGRVFVSADVDPKTDPDGASVRVWRKQ